MKPVRFNLDQSLETLTAHSGLAHIGLLLSHTRIAAAEAESPVLPNHGTVLVGRCPPACRSVANTVS